LIHSLISWGQLWDSEYSDPTKILKNRTEICAFSSNIPQNAATCRTAEEPLGRRPSCTWSSLHNYDVRNDR